MFDSKKQLSLQQTNTRMKFIIEHFVDIIKIETKIYQKALIRMGRSMPEKTILHTFEIQFTGQFYIPYLYKTFKYYGESKCLKERWYEASDCDFEPNGVGVAINEHSKVIIYGIFNK